MTGEANLAKTPAVTDDSPMTTADPGSIAGSQDGFDAQQILALARHPPPGASVYSPTAVPTAALNPRSCVTCRRRKVRCDKHMPCSNCRRAQIPCIFPAPGRAPRRPRPKDPNAPAKQPSSEREREMMKRLRKLEGIVEELSGQLEVDSVRHPYSASNSPEAGPSYARDDHTIGGRLGPGAHAASVGGAQDSPGNGPNAGETRLPARPPSGTVSEPDSVGKASPEVHKQFGRLVLHENGVARYVSSSLWSSISDELDELRKASQDLGDEDSDASDLDASPDSADHDKALMDHQSFIHGYRSADVDLRPLHPLPSQIPYIWQVYRENVDPILKVIHAPTVSKLIKDIRDNMDNLTPSTEALMFSIYYAAVTSLDEDEVMRNFGAEKRDLIQKYRFAVEQALAKAEFLTKPDLTVFQAFLLFLVIVRRQDDTRFAWTLTGLLIRLSQALGLHRDGTHFSNLTPFEIEMRRRLFWAVCVLDLRSSEDQGAELTIVDRSFDTKLPLNINDDDISPDSQSLPEPRKGTSDMAFSLSRYEIMSLARRLHIASSDWTLSSEGDADKSLEEREALLSEVYQRVQERLLLRDSSNPMFWVTSNVTSIVFAKMTLVIYQPMLFPGPGYEELAEDVRSRLLNAVIDIFEYRHVLISDPRCKQWRWLFQTWSHWHALAYALVEVSRRRWGPKAERVWSAINLLLSSPSSPELEKLASHHAVWLPLKKLYFKVKKHREAEIARLRADPQAARELDLHDQSVISTATFFATPTSLTGLCAVDHWRKLVNLPPPPEEPIRAPEEQLPQHAPPLKPERERPMQESNAVSKAPAVGSADLNEHELMKYLDATMSSPSAHANLVFGALWNSSHSEEIARPAFLGYPPAHASRGDAGIGFEPSTASTNVDTPAIAASMGVPGYMPPPPQQQQQQTQPAMVQTPLPGDNPAPWLWPIGGSPDILRMPSANGEDMDVNMDETFDWQTWGENLGRYELEANGGRAGSTWAPGL